MKRIIKYAAYLLLYLTAVSCIQEVWFEQNESENGIRFATKHYNIDIQKTKTHHDETQGPKETYFLGMLGDDSLFYYVSESIISPATKSSGNTNALESFHLTAYRSDESTPYIDGLKLQSEDNWASYSPMTYWPYKYTTIDFFAYNVNNTTTPVFKHSGEYSAYFEHTIPKDSEGNDASAQSHLIFAFAPTQKQGEEPVELSFVHTMAGVRFRLGPMGDADLDNLHIELTDVISEGSCIVAHTESGNTVTWNHEVDSKQTFTHNFPTGEEDAFIIIPQDLTGTEISFTASINIGGKIHTFEPRLLSEATAKWEEGKMYTYTITSGGYVESTITEQSTSTKFTDFSIQNTGWTTSFVRAALMGYWYITETRTENGATTTTEKIVATWKPDDTTTGNFSKSSDWDTYWQKGDDGLYYYNFALLPGSPTLRPLFDEYELTKEAPIDGAKLRISVAVQAVQHTKANSAWPSTPII